MKDAGYAAIVLAGGFSSRMQKFKPLLPLGKGTITDILIATFLNTGTDVYLVVGYRGDDIRTDIKTENIQIIENPDYQEGMFSSIRIGLSSLGPGYPATFIIPVDIPLVRTDTIERMIITAKAHPDAIIYPVFQGKRGHPPLIPATLFKAILDWRGDGGLNSVLRAHEDIAIEVDVDDNGILFDVDEPGDYKILLERFGSNEV